MKILYVEDNPANLSLLQRIARMGGHQVITYTEGEKALDNFEKDSPDLVLMDVQLSGGMNGLDVVRKMRERGFKKPIVAVTAYAMTGDKERCIEAGCDTYLAKPLPVTELVELVKKYEDQLTAAKEPATSSAPAFVEVENDEKTTPVTNTKETTPAPLATTPKELPAQPATSNISDKNNTSTSAAPSANTTEELPTQPAVPNISDKNNTPTTARS